MQDGQPALVFLVPGLLRVTIGGMILECVSGVRVEGEPTPERKRRISRCWPRIHKWFSVVAGLRNRKKMGRAFSLTAHREKQGR